MGTSGPEAQGLVLTWDERPTQGLELLSCVCLPARIPNVSDLPF